MKSNKSLFEKSPDIIPVDFSKGMNISKFVHALGQTSFEARNVYKGAKLYKHIINSDNIIWLGIAGAGIAGGMGGIVISLIKAGFIDVICSTGAQVYHDLHFAFDLPVKAIHPTWDDDILRKHGDTRIYDIGIREEETLEAQDEIIRNFIKDSYKILSNHPLSSCEFNKILGDWVNKHARYPERSFVATAARYNVPVFWDSLSNHSIAMNLVRTDREGYPIQLSAQKDILSSAAITYNSEKTGFVELGGGGPKNFIQQTGPTISQILGIDFAGAESGLQITTAVEKEGSLSSCTFSEAVTWGKYTSTDEEKLIHIWGEYSIIFPILAAYVLDECKVKPTKSILTRLPDFIVKLENAS